PSLVAAAPVRVSDGPITALAYRADEAGAGILVAAGSGRDVFFLRRKAEPVSGTPSWDLLPLPVRGAPVTAVALDASLSDLYAADAAGQIRHFHLAPSGHPEWFGTYQLGGGTDPVTRLEFLLGDRSLVAMTQGGSVS